MAEAEQQPTQAQPELLAAAAPWADTFSKAVAAIGITVYATGFLIVSLHESQYGFVGTNPFRPKVLAAGTWFFFFVGIPASVAATYRSTSWKTLARNSANILMACYLLSFPIADVLFSYAASSWVQMPGWLWIALPLGWLVLLFATIHRKTPEWMAITSSLLLTLLYVSEPLHRLSKHEFDSLCLGLWFFAVWIVAMLEVKTRTRVAMTSYAGWTKPVAVLFVTVLVFAQYLYPHLKSSWGGGTPVNVTLYFTKDSVLNPSKTVQAQLIEESDAGFYIVGPKESNAIFIPRNSVAMIYFSDKAAQSPMLQGVR